MNGIDVVIGLLLGILITFMSIRYLEEFNKRKDVIPDEDYKKIDKKLCCPECGSVDYQFAEVTGLPWIPGEDRYCICNRCGRQFGDGK